MATAGWLGIGEGGAASSAAAAGRGVDGEADGGAAGVAVAEVGGGWGFRREAVRRVRVGGENMLGMGKEEFSGGLGGVMAE